MNPLGFSTMLPLAHSLYSALTHFGTHKLLIPLLSFSLGVVISLGHHSRSVRARDQILPVPQPPHSHGLILKHVTVKLSY